MSLSRVPGDEPDIEASGDWSLDATLKKEDYFNTYLDGKRSPNDAAFEPELANLLTKLYERQRDEANRLLDRTKGEMQLYDQRHNEAHAFQGGGCSPETLEKYRDEFRKEYRERCQGFAQERDRHIGDFQRAREIRDQLELESRQRSFEQDLDAKPERTL